MSISSANQSAFHFASFLVSSVNAVLMDQTLKSMGKSDNSRSERLRKARENLAAGLRTLEDTVALLEKSEGATVKGLDTGIVSLASQASYTTAGSTERKDLLRRELRVAQAWLSGNTPRATDEVINTLRSLRGVLEGYLKGDLPFSMERV